MTLCNDAENGADSIVSKPLFENRSPKPPLTLPEFAAMLRISQKSFYRGISSGELAGIGFKVRGRWRFDWDDALAALKSRSKSDGHER